jgi:hypothetical protein
MHVYGCVGVLRRGAGAAGPALRACQPLLAASSSFKHSTAHTPRYNSTHTAQTPSSATQPKPHTPPRATHQPNTTHHHGQHTNQTPHTTTGNTPTTHHTPPQETRPPGPGPAAPGPPPQSPQWAPGWPGCLSPQQSCLAAQGREAWSAAYNKSDGGWNARADRGQAARGVCEEGRRSAVSSAAFSWVPAGHPNSASTSHPLSVFLRGVKGTLNPQECPPTL